MADKSKIAWTDATLNPAYGCSKVSEACQNCYAIQSAKRLASIGSTDHLCAGLVENDQWTGRIRMFPERMKQALRWQKPRRIFVGSMTDLFHERIPLSFLDDIFSIMAEAKQHTFQILTKRVDRMADYIDSRKDMERQVIPNVWLGCTVENQARVNERVPVLVEIPAAVRFVSIEPMLGEIDLQRVQPAKKNYHIRALDGFEEDEVDLSVTEKVNWVICGCESLGAKREGRHMEIGWVRSLRDQCVKAGTPFFLKQAAFNGNIEHCPELDGQVWTQFPEAGRVVL